jgi:hypothetical protein
LGLTVGTTYLFLRWLEETPEEEAERKREEEQLQQRRAAKDAARAQGVQVADDDDDDEKEEEAEPILFLPTGFSRAKPRQFYKGSDPEWQEFVRIAPDRQRIERIRGELVGMIRDIAMKSPQYVMRLGKINPAAGTSWIEFKFPDGPPLEFERPGVEITDELTIRKTSRPVNEISHHRLTNILFPSAVANSLYADSKTKLGRTWVDLKVYMGWEQPKKNKTHLQQMIAALPPNHPPFTPQSTPSTTPSPASSTPPPTTSGALPPSSEPSAPAKEPTSPIGEDPAYYDRFGLSLPKPTALTLDLSTFRNTFSKEHRKNVMKLQPPRGTFMVSGLVEIIGERARMTLDVAAAYDPKLGKFVMLQAKLRTLTPYRQDPKGGP